MTSYRYYLLGSLGIVGRGDFAVADDATALCVAELLSNACRDVASGYELWKGCERIRAAGAVRTSSKENIDARILALVTDLEIALRSSHRTIAESKRLLETPRQDGELVDGVLGSVA